ncbi:MAG: ATP-binding cassette domain-containing protein [Betaproteobacteria bacterium]|nr:ATP-binding cassette domain-containing protein [Betaproteobacteria bacterium]
MASAAPILPLHVDALGYRVGEVSILDSVSFRLEAGSRTIVLGPNGAGKSVLLRLLHGLLKPGAGTIAWAAPAPQRAQAMVFQRPVMLRRSVRENIEFALQLAGKVDVADRKQGAMAALEQVGLAHLADRPARLCSGGEQQRVALARAWALQPQVLFLDEPTASLDPAATRAIEDTIVAMHRAGTTIVMTTHDIAQARRLADRILFLHHGRLAEDAPAATFFQQPKSPEAAAFIKGELLW